MTSIKILGINSAGFNTSSSLIIDGKIIYAVEEERLNREKRTRNFPFQGIKEALKTAGIKLEELDAIAVAWNPAINLELHNHAQSSKARYLGEIFYNVPSALMSLKKNNQSSYSRQVIEFKDGTNLNIYYIMHHLSHASTFYYSPFETASIMTIDAFGEKECVLFAEGNNTELKTIWSQEFPHSLGGFYSTMTEFLGFQPQSDEWKLMGAAPYGDPKQFYEKLRKLIIFKDDGFELDLSYFNFYLFHRPGRFTQKFSDYIGLPPNPKDNALNELYYNLAASSQLLMEEIYFHLLNQLHKKSKFKDNLVLAGGVVFNSVANGKILQNTLFKEVYIPPVPDDSGGSLGASYYVYHQILKHPRKESLSNNYLGPGFNDSEIQDELDKYKVNYSKLENPSYTAAELISFGKIIGWFQGRLEFGDRALGNRSILADPRNPEMKDKVNETIKYRESFRPFAPSILIEKFSEYFEDATPTPFMEKVFPIKKEKQSLIPAVTHVDGTGRLQTVSKEQNLLYYSLIQEFEKLTGIPIVLNTSFNLKGEPMVSSPKDAIRTFFTSGLDALIIGDFLIVKK
ncbi:MAG: carbamoyltransferase C-terminal domain-containing protein [Leptospiraceae bacterium]|nr:carbamoyltransferase C-terminal domain-containing protein [Leptospiraceae bacterium]